jgi:hypothetical protein
MVPQFFIDWVEIDDGNEPHLTKRGLTPTDYVFMLMGMTAAARNKKAGSADYVAHCTTADGRRWMVFFQYDSREHTARPITAIPA